MNSFTKQKYSHQIRSDQLLSQVGLFATPWIPARQASLAWVQSDSRPFNQWCHPAILSTAVPFSSCPQSLPESVFSNESTLHIRWPKYWSFSLSIGPSKEHPGLISFRMELIGSPCSPRDSQESSPTPQFKSINSLALSHSSYKMFRKTEHAQIFWQSLDHKLLHMCNRRYWPKGKCTIGKLWL